MADDTAGCRVEERVQRGKFNLSWIMAKHGQKICLLLALIFTVIAVLSNRTPVTKKVKNQFRFFSVSSPVIDFYNGNLDDLIDKLEESEIAAVMFYAPWSAESLHARWEFDRTARFFNNQIGFMAINCWWADGTCRQKQKITAFPLIYVYPRSLDGIQYRGVLAAEYLISFLDKFINPITVLFTEEDISTFLYKQDIGVLGFFDFHSSPQPPGYPVFYQSALKALERDPRQQIKFGIIPSWLAASLCNFTHHSTVKLFELHNTSMRNYPLDAEFKVDSLLSWIFSHNRQVVPILNPPGVKSMLLSNVIAQKPVAILLAPDNPLASSFPGLSVFREVALEYFNCKNASSLKWAIHQNWIDRQYRKKLDQKLEDSCLELSKKNRNIPIIYTSHCCQSVVIQKSVNMSEQNVCDICVCQRKQFESYCLLPNHDYSVFHKMSTSLHGCSIIYSSYNPHEEVMLCCQRNKTLKPTIDIRSSCNPKVKESTFYLDEFPQQHQNYKCKLKKFSKKIQKPFLGSKASIKSLPWETLDEFSGLGCRTNRTLKFFTLDTWEYYAFAERLGLPLKGIKKSTGELVILDRSRETQFVLNKELTHVNIAQFLWNYTYGQLDRFFRSSELKSSLSIMCDNFKSPTKVCIVEVTSITFKQVVLDEKKDVVLLYFTPWCGFCAGIAHIYLSVARYFKMTSKLLLFARINADVNDLPWEFTVENYPTIIFFPAQRKAESTAFPSHLPITFQNLVRFILLHAQKHLKLQTALSICSHLCIENNRKLALTQVRNLHNEITSIKLQIHRLQSRLDNTSHMSANDQNVAFWTTTLQNYIVYLRREVRRKSYQSHNAKLLYKTLDETKGLFIDGSKLSTVMNAYHNYHQEMRNITTTVTNNIFSDKSKEWQNIDSPSTVKDEL